MSTGLPAASRACWRFFTAMLMSLSFLMRSGRGPPPGSLPAAALWDVDRRVDTLGIIVRAASAAKILTEFLVPRGSGCYLVHREDVQPDNPGFGPCDRVSQPAQVGVCPKRTWA